MGHQQSSSITVEWDIPVDFPISGRAVSSVLSCQRPVLQEDPPQSIGLGQAVGEAVLQANVDSHLFRMAEVSRPGLAFNWMPFPSHSGIF